MVAENVLDTLGDDLVAWEEAAHELIYDVLIELSKRQNLPRSLDNRVAIEHQQMILCP